MAFIEVQKRNGKEYYYLAKSIRVSKDKWEKKRVYLGNKKPSKEQIQKKLLALENQIKNFDSYKFLEEKNVTLLEELKIGFEEWKKKTPDSLKEKIVLATCSSVNENGIREVLKRTEVKHVLKQDQIAKEVELVELLLEQISKNNLATYGLREVKKAVNVGAVEKLLLTDKKILKAQQEEKYKDLESMMKLVEQTKGEVHIISSDHEGGQKLDGLTGIAVMLRYKLQY